MILYYHLLLLWLGVFGVLTGNTNAVHHDTFTITLAGRLARESSSGCIEHVSKITLNHPVA